MQRSNGQPSCRQAQGHDQAGGTPSAPVAKPVIAEPTVAADSSPLELSPLMQALAILRENAVLWAKNGDPTKPPPPDVLQQLWEIFESDPGVAD